ncbi:Similar to SV2B: Synaptic vesicle glycoprotein 2B (Homo sapiens) [Cotesia congregata]|uniref:Similar to SV2B: Synaptic vesicle glycoprotein 2B (Homo sapiens) n=1 Tax=Cotesia congregata TaxID=51543 RepID=A0A8J2HCA5_COTCN|nr:Similar to SV2B: Synaptic vesicle glycoprotein 2B (Homo sapiens) [Cotesia congregata]
MGTENVKVSSRPSEISIAKIAQDLINAEEDSDQSQAEINTQLAVNATGFGKFNYKVTIVSGLTCMNAGIGINILGLILPSAACDFDMSTVDKGRLNTGFIFAGFDCLASLIPNYWGVFVCKTIVGFALGGQMATLYTYVGEFQPAIYRKKILSTMEIPVVLGIIVASLFGWIIVPITIDVDFGGFFFHSWNLFVIVCSIPTWIIGVCLYFLPETPKYLSEFGMGEELFRVLSKIYFENTGKSPDEYLIELNKCGISSVSQLLNMEAEEKLNESKLTKLTNMLFQQTGILLKPPFLGRTLVVCTIMFSIFSSMYTLMMWFPELFDRFAAFETAFPNEHASVCHCHKEINTQVYVHTLILGVASVPIAVLFPMFVNRIGFKISLAVGMVICAASTVGLFFVRSSLENLVLSSLFEALISVCSTVICCVVVEIFPTKLRATAAALGSLSARSGALIGNTAFSYLIDHYCVILISCLTGQLIVGGIMSLFLPNQKKEHTPKKKISEVNSQAARLPGRRRCRLRTCHHRHRFWQIPLHAVDNLRFDLHGHSNRSNNNIIRSTSSAMRPSNGFDIQRMAHSLPHVRNGDRIILLGVPG